MIQIPRALADGANQRAITLLIPRVVTTLPGSRLRVFFAMQIQHSYTSSTNGWTFPYFTLPATEIRRNIHSC